MYAIDCDDLNTKYDDPAGHSYFLADKKGKAAKFSTIFLKPSRKAEYCRERKQEGK